MIEKLDLVVRAMDVRLKGIKHQCNLIESRAKQFHAEKDLLRCKSELRILHEKKLLYERYVEMHAKMTRIRASIDETQSIVDMASTLGAANNLLQEVILKVNPEQIESLMDSLDDQSAQVRDMGDALARADAFDEEAAMRELIDDPVVPDSPVLPVSAPHPPRRTCDPRIPA